MRIATNACMQLNEDYPKLCIDWTYDMEHPSRPYSGIISLYKNSYTILPERHRISLYQSCPLGQIEVLLDESGHGCFAHGQFSGATITERDLQWATLWAVQAIKRLQIEFKSDDAAS